MATRTLLGGLFRLGQVGGGVVQFCWAAALAE
ncbi:hypothetical protein SAMN05443551_0425 [Marivita hallyeonensis]|uniref:Uncharacterized protein n=1 Tax=Marivita hallyeonensis TaxID=996342 RepID=A0A1M5M9V5_9RHOB|nr:hypothetical protein SAMN05443551_0425 [Marivita hallyeonensis]